MRETIIILLIMLYNLNVAVGQNSATKAAYTKLIRKADSLYFVGSCKAAKETFQLAKTVLKKEFYASTRINEIVSCMSRSDTAKTTCPCKIKPTITYNKRADFVELIKTYDKIDSLLLINDYKSTQNMLRKFDYKKLRDQLESEIRAIELEIKYEEMIREGDIAMNKKDFSSAKAKYQTALSFRPAAVLATQKIKEVDVMIKNINEADYLVKQGDDQKNKTDYQAALLNYEKALLLFPNNQIIKDRIASVKQQIDKK